MTGDKNLSAMMACVFGQLEQAQQAGLLGAEAARSARRAVFRDYHLLCLLSTRDAAGHFIVVDSDLPDFLTVKG